MPWDKDVPALTNTLLRSPTSSSSEASVFANNATPASLDSQDSLSLLNAACYVVQALKDRDFDALACVIHPEKGVTFTPYSTVDFSSDLTFTKDQVKNLAADNKIYTWGITDGRGSLINMTVNNYLVQYVFNADYTHAPQIGVDQIILSGNALENLADAYPNCRFVDFSFPGLDSSNQGLDWSSLKLVFEPGDTCWYLVGIVHGEWTI